MNIKTLLRVGASPEPGPQSEDDGGTSDGPPDDG